LGPTLPIGHAVGTEVPAVGHIEPVGHAAQLDVEIEYVPAAHGTHAVNPVVDAILPLLQI
jgi:hypothetical protein